MTGGRLQGWIRPAACGVNAQGPAWVYRLAVIRRHCACMRQPRRRGPALCGLAVVERSGPASNSGPRRRTLRQPIDESAGGAAENVIGGLSEAFRKVRSQFCRCAATLTPPLRWRFKIKFLHIVWHDIDPSDADGAATCHLAHCSRLICKINEVERQPRNGADRESPAAETGSASRGRGSADQLNDDLLKSMEIHAVRIIGVH